jgi:hypothetical protein
MLRQQKQTPRWRICLASWSLCSLQCGSPPSVDPLNNLCHLRMYAWAACRVCQALLCASFWPVSWRRRALRWFWWACGPPCRSCFALHSDCKPQLSHWYAIRALWKSMLSVAVHSWLHTCPRLDTGSLGQSMHCCPLHCNTRDVGVSGGADFGISGAATL